MNKGDKIISTKMIPASYGHAALMMPKHIVFSESIVAIYEGTRYNNFFEVEHTFTYKGVLYRTDPHIFSASFILLSDYREQQIKSVLDDNN